MIVISFLLVNKELSVCQHLTFNTYFPKIMAFWLANNSTRRLFKLTRTKTTALTPMANAGQNVTLHCLKLCLKSISSHSESFWKKKLGEKWGGTPILSHFFLQKCPKSGLVS